MFNLTSSDERLHLPLRILGVMCVLAVVPAVMPFQCLDFAHRSMDLGPFPSAPIANYLARSVSSLSTFYGGLLLLLSRDVVRFAPIIRYQAVAIMLFSDYGIFAGIRAGLPAIWVIGDTIGCWLFLLPVCLLSQSITANEIKGARP